MRGPRQVREDRDGLYSIADREAMTRNIDVAIRCAVWPSSEARNKMYMDCARDLRATRRWFAAREAGWTPAERVRRAAFYACEPWAE